MSDKDNADYTFEFLGGGNSNLFNNLINELSEKADLNNFNFDFKKLNTKPEEEEESSVWFVFNTQDNITTISLSENSDDPNRRSWNQTFNGLQDSTTPNNIVFSNIPNEMGDTEPKKQIDRLYRSVGWHNYDSDNGCMKQGSVFTDKNTTINMGQFAPSVPVAETIISEGRTDAVIPQGTSFFISKPLENQKQTKIKAPEGAPVPIITINPPEENKTVKLNLKDAKLVRIELGENIDPSKLQFEFGTDTKVLFYCNPDKLEALKTKLSKLKRENASKVHIMIPDDATKVNSNSQLQKILPHRNDHLNARS